MKYTTVQSQKRGLVVQFVDMRPLSMLPRGGPDGGFTVALLEPSYVVARMTQLDFLPWSSVVFMSQHHAPPWE